MSEFLYFQVSSVFQRIYFAFLSSLIDNKFPLVFDISVARFDFERTSRHISHNFHLRNFFCLFYEYKNLTTRLYELLPIHITYTWDSNFGYYIVHSPTNSLLIKLGKSLKFALKYTQISLLHVSVYDHHQGAGTEPG